MAYKTFRELAGESGNVNSAFQTSYTKTFLIEVDEPTDSVFYVGSHPSLPLIFSPHPSDPRAFCVSINPQQDSDNPLIWRVTCQWSMAMDSMGVGGMQVATGNPFIDSQQAGKPPTQRQEQPLVRGNDYSYDTIVIGKEVVEFDEVTLDAILNTAGDPFETLPEREIYGLQITIGRNLPGPPGSAWDNLAGKLNRNTCLIGTRTCAPRTAMMMPTSAQLLYENSTAYWRWTHRVVIKTADDWKWHPMSKGKNGILPFRDGPGAGAAIVYRKGNIARHYRNLAGDQPLDENGYVVALTTGATPHRMSFNYLMDDVFPEVL